MPKLSSHHPKIIAGLSLFILLAMYLAYVILSRPVIGIDVKLTPQGRVTVTSVAAGSWSEQKFTPEIRFFRLMGRIRCFWRRSANITVLRMWIHSLLSIRDRREIR